MTSSGHVGAIVITGSTPLWYATRATGLVALVLLTASMALGLLSSVRFQRPAWPRFVTLGLHRNLALLALGFTAVHVLTTVLDSFVAIPLQDAFIPFISSYRPIWVGLGAIALDLMLALIITSLLRTRMGLRSWLVPRAQGRRQQPARPDGTSAWTSLLLNRREKVAASLLNTSDCRLNSTKVNCSVRQPMPGDG